MTTGVDGFAFAVTTVAVDVALQPLASVTVTLKEPEVTTLIDCPDERNVAPFDHAYAKPLGALSVTEPPAQNVVGPDAVIAGVAGFAFAVIVICAEVALQPFASITLTVTFRESVTVIDCVCSSVLHE
jgi:hypothetical protein